ncbi:hypothetical protein V2J09_023208 [Rumex salicifolius]
MWRWWRRANSSSNVNLRRLTTAVRRQIEDEGDWRRYSSEWWGTETGEDHANVVLQETSDFGNGVVSVLAYPSSKPSAVYWPATERWLNERYAELNPNSTGDHDKLRVLGYQWRVLRFNGNTRQSAVKVMAASNESEPGSLYLAQQGLCLAVPYLKSMVSAGFTSLASCNYELLLSAVRGDRPLRVLCIGHGGGSLPLFLASTIPGAIVDIIEIDPLVISTSIRAMGFPSYAIASPHGQHCPTKPDMIDEVLWRGVHERLFLIESDAENFMLNNTNVYDLVFIDAYDGDDIFPHKLWDPNSPFLNSLESKLHPDHGTVVVNLHSDADILDSNASVSSLFDPVLPMGKYVTAVCQAYKDVLVRKQGGSGIAFAVGVPWVCNTSLVVSRGFRGDGGVLDRDSVMNCMFMKCVEIEKALDLPFSCLEYINLRRRFVLLD